ncbi:MAG: zinc-binding dehydrogenase [Pseudomonadota bacterium]|nr:zinc-binding dehydrogenase [Pseudomonadota bacterium]
MKAIRVPEYGDSTTLSYDEIPIPVLQEDEVLVDIEIAGVNFIDIYNRKGLYAKSQTYSQSLPMTLGMEGGGIVKALGKSVKNLNLGNRVAYRTELGSYAEFAKVAAWKIIPVSEDIPLDIANALMLQGSTAHYLSHSLFPVDPRHRYLIHAASGGVGQLLVQLAKARGAEVFALVSSQEKADLAIVNGADHTTLYKKENFAESVLELTNGEGVHVVYGSIGKMTIAESLRATKNEGLVLTMGLHPGLSKLLAH